MSGQTAEFKPVESARLQFLLSIDRLLKASDQARLDRDRLLKLVEAEHGEDEKR